MAPGMGENAMRVRVALLVLCCALTSAEAADIKGTSRIDTVTVYPSGAEVARVGKVRLDAGDHTILFTDLPARAIAGSIRIEGKATGRLEIGSVDNRRTFVSRTDDAIAASERKRIEDAIEKLKDGRLALQATIAAAEAQKTLIANLAQLPTRPPSATGGAVMQPDWGQIFGLIGQRFAEAQKVILDTQIQIRDTDRQIKDLEGKLASLAPAQEERTEVKVFVTAATALEADIVIRYQVASASWTPFYDARLTTGTKTEAPTLQLVRRALIRQRSGESWDEVALALSTARPGAGTAAPELQTVTIDYEAEAPPRPSAPVASAPRSTLRDGAARGRADSDEREHKAASESVAAEEQSAKVEAAAFQAIYSIAGRVTVPTTGEMKRVQIDETQLEPTLTVRTAPKREQKAYLYAKATTARGTPILPGQVSLFRDATFVGTGKLPLLAPGEEHELGFGVDDTVRVRHTIAEEKRAESGIITSSMTDTRNYRLTVKNLHERPIPVTVLDQIPVSQNADIKIELLGKSAPTRRDVDNKRGVLAWDAKLEPGEEKVIEFGYRVTWPSAKRIVFSN